MNSGLAKVKGCRGSPKIIFCDESNRFNDENWGVPTRAWYVCVIACLETVSWDVRKRGVVGPAFMLTEFIYGYK